MAHKRPFDDEVADEGSSKHQRQDGQSDENSLCNDSFSREGASGTSNDIGESSIGKDELELHQEHENASGPSIAREVVEDVESDVPRSASLSHWAASGTSYEDGSTSDEDELPEELVQFYPGYFSFDRPVRPVINPDEVYYCLLDYPPRKRVPVGPDHQAEIPSWGTEVNRTTSDGLGSIEPASSGENSVGIVDGELGGICILPIPKTQPFPFNGDNIGYGRIECACPDQGSMICVRLHIVEARDKLRSTLGQETFMELGFCDMGEVVADKWSGEEEQLFHEVVYSNPVSLGKNFWNVLSAVFPSRTKMEIVSYYFNVFMLRKRAKQNRCGSMSIDSDNDEWQGSDDGLLDEDEDSGIQFPVRHGELELNQNGLHLLEDKHEPGDDADLSDEAREYDGNSGDGIARKSDPDSAFDPPGKKSDDDAENDVQHGSCPSDSRATVRGSGLKADGCQEWNEYIIDSSDAKAWDGYSLSCPKQNVDFLPTCSMIKEVFGEGDFDSEDKRW